LGGVSARRIDCPSFTSTLHAIFQQPSWSLRVLRDRSLRCRPRRASNRSALEQPGIVAGVVSKQSDQQRVEVADKYAGVTKKDAAKPSVN
jgi:hypothetical protein